MCAVFSQTFREAKITAFYSSTNGLQKQKTVSNTQTLRGLRENLVKREQQTRSLRIGAGAKMGCVLTH
jgi:hypothetical protein